jgi:RimJ/RimL family protein N-acetyltransferase
MQPGCNDRIRLVQLGLEDWRFLLELLNQSDFIANIRDSGVRSEEQARKFIQDFYLASYARQDFGLWGIELNASGEKVGICGLVKRDGLDGLDLGFALLSEHQGKGYAYQAAQLTMSFAREQLKLSKLLAITSEKNHSSIALLEKLGFGFQSKIRLAPEAPEVRLYQRQL